MKAPNAYLGYITDEAISTSDPSKAPGPFELPWISQIPDDLARHARETTRRMELAQSGDPSVGEISPRPDLDEFSRIRSACDALAVVDFEEGNEITRRLLLYRHDADNFLIVRLGPLGINECLVQNLPNTVAFLAQVSPQFFEPIKTPEIAPPPPGEELDPKWITDVVASAVRTLRINFFRSPDTSQSQAELLLLQCPTGTWALIGQAQPQDKSSRLQLLRLDTNDARKDVLEIFLREDLESAEQGKDPWLPQQ